MSLSAIPVKLRCFLNNGASFSVHPLNVVSGETVAVVLLSLGEPQRIEDLKPFLYLTRIDPARGWLHRWLTKRKIERVYADWAKGFENVGGGSPFTRTKRDLQVALEERLNETPSFAEQVSFKVFLSNSFGPSSHQEVLAEIKAAGIQKVVLVPLYPHFGRYTSGLVLMHWKEALRKSGFYPETSLIHEYALNPNYLQALSERIDEALRRFPKHLRELVTLQFCVYGASSWSRERTGDPLVVLIQESVEALRALRQEKRPMHVSFLNEMILPGRCIKPCGRETLHALVEQGQRNILMIPISFISERFETAYLLDLELRKEAEEIGVQHYEVGYGINGHALFLEAVTQMVRTKLHFEAEGASTYRAQDWKVRSLDGQELWIQTWQSLNDMTSAQRHSLPNFAGSSSGSNKLPNSEKDLYRNGAKAFQRQAS